MSNPVLWENKENVTNLLSVELAQCHVNGRALGR